MTVSYARIITLLQGRDSLTVRLSRRYLPTIAPSAVLIWILGVCAACFASYRAAAHERYLAQGKDDDTAEIVIGGRGDDPPPQTITASTAVAFLCISSLGLLGLYFLFRAGIYTVIMFLIVMFGLGSIGAFTHIFVYPMISWCIPSLLQKEIQVPSIIVKCCYEAVDSAGNTTDASAINGQRPTVNLGYVLSLVISVATSVTWMLCPHSSWAWVIQNIFGLAICALFLLTLQLPSARVSTVMLSLFFFYDIFMVFISYN